MFQRAAELGDGWMGAGHTPTSAAERVRTLEQLRGAGPLVGQQVVESDATSTKRNVWTEGRIDRRDGVRGGHRTEHVTTVDAQGNVIDDHTNDF